MKTKPAVLVLVTVIALLQTATIYAQSLNPPYLNEMPTVERIKAEIKGADPMETAARQMGACWQLRQLIYDLAWTLRRQGRDNVTPDEKRLADAYYAGYYYASQPYEHIQNSPSHPDKPKWYKMHAFYETDPGFLDELFKGFFSAQFRTEVYQVTGKKPPQLQTVQPSAPSKPSTQPTKSASTRAKAYLSSGDSAYKVGLQLKDKKDWTKMRAALDSAITFYKKAIALDPTLVEAYSNLGATYVEKGFYTVAVDTLKKALSLNPNHPKTFNTLGLAYLYLEQFQSALAAFEQAARLKPGEAVYHYNLGYTYADMGKKDDALKIYKTLEKIDKAWAQKLDEKINKSTKPTTSTPRPKTFANPKIEMEWIPPGNFLMGSEKGGDAVKPAHRVTFSKGFYMGKYEVTQVQWQAVMGDNPSFFKDCSNCPVEQVSWNDAQEFIDRLNQLKDGFKYRLPSEAEWEYAYRAGTTGYYYAQGDIGWYGGTGSSAGNSENKTHPVGGKLPNAFDLYDMAGNVYEWCSDWYHENYNGAPGDGSPWLEAEVKKYRVNRGGSFYAMWSALSAEIRFKELPDSRSRNNGFRVVAVWEGGRPSASAGASAEDYVAQGDKYYKAKDTTKAIEAYKKAVFLQPSLSAAHYALGGIYSEQRQYQKAVLSLQEALRLKPGDSKDYTRLGLALYYVKQNPKALEAFQQVVRRTPDSASAHTWIGFLHMELKEYEKAVSAFREVLRLQPNNADACNRLGLAYISLKQYPDAVAALKQATTLKPDFAVAHFNLGFAYVDMGKKEDALQVHTALQKLDAKLAQNLLENKINKMK